MGDTHIFDTNITSLSSDLHELFYICVVRYAKLLKTNRVLPNFVRKLTEKGWVDSEKINL